MAFETEESVMCSIILQYVYRSMYNVYMNAILGIVLVTDVTRERRGGEGEGKCLHLLRCPYQTQLCIN